MLIIFYFLISLLTQHYYFIDTQCESLTHYRVYNYYSDRALLFFITHYQVSNIFHQNTIPFYLLIVRSHWCMACCPYTGAIWRFNVIVMQQSFLLRIHIVLDEILQVCVNISAFECRNLSVTFMCFNYSSPVER